MLLIEKIKKTSFSTSEQLVIDYILNQKEAIKSMTIKEISSRTYTNPSILIRISKKLGFRGWNECKALLLEEMTYLSKHFSDVDANYPFSKQDNVLTIAHKMAVLEQETIKDTLSLISYEALQEATIRLTKASFIQLFANNQNLVISQDFMFKMNRIQKHVSISNIDGEQVFDAFNCDKNFCAILISYSGESTSLNKTARILKSNQVPFITITSLGENSLSKQSDCILHIATRERLYSKIANFTSNASICYLLDVLYSCVFAQNYDANLKRKIDISKYVDPRTSSVDLLREK